MEKIVVSLGGSVILSDDSDSTFYNNLSRIISKLSLKYKIFIVVGGGKVAREYIKKGRTLGLKENILDDFGIQITHINAKLLTCIIDGSNKNIPLTTKEASELNNKIIIMGGTTSGHSTDYVAAELAKISCADRLIIATNVDGIYDKDPHKYKQAIKLPKVSINTLIKQYGKNWNKAGSNVVIDGPALELIEKNKLTTYVVNGKKLDELEKAITNQIFNGTIINK